MPKSIYDVTLSKLTKNLKSLTLCCMELRTVEPMERNGIKTEPYVVAEVEIARGQGAFSRCRFEVKLPFHNLAFDETYFDEGDYCISFEELRATYVNASTKKIYFSAPGYSIVQEDTGERIFAFRGA